MFVLDVNMLIQNRSYVLQYYGIVIVRVSKAFPILMLSYIVGQLLPRHLTILS